MIRSRTRSTTSLYRSSKRSIFWTAVFTALCWILVVSNLSVSGAPLPIGTASATSTSTSESTFSPGNKNTVTDSDSHSHGVIELTSKSFGSEVGFGDGTVWLIEFYTQTCSHCLNFAQTYSGIAHTLHSSGEKIRVARVDCMEEKALMTRFGINAFPSFYLVSGWDVYEFTGTRGSSTLIDFARGGYKKQKPIPFLNSPMGPKGMLQGSLIFVGTRIMGLLEDIDTKFGISPMISAVIICMFGVCCGMISVILLAVISTPKGPEKKD